MATTGKAGTVLSSRTAHAKNWEISVLFHRKDFKGCQVLIEESKTSTGRISEYGHFVQGLIHRRRGHLRESLQSLREALSRAPARLSNLKQVAKGLYLLGRFDSALEVYNEALNYTEDWSIWHNKGLCYAKMEKYEEAGQCLERAMVLSPQDVTYLQLAKVHLQREDFSAALTILQEGLESSPQNIEILVALGLLHMRLGEHSRAFDYLGSALSVDARDAKAIIAAGSIIQDNGDMDVALIKYRVAAVHAPSSAHLWNNIGMCFFGKRNLVAAIACLKRALALDPFAWIIAYNLGVVYLNFGQYASAFHYFSSAVNLKPDYAMTYMYLAVTLARLDDFENACSAYERALTLKRDPLIELNYAITLFDHDAFHEARIHYDESERLFQSLPGNQRDLLGEKYSMQRNMLREALGLGY